ncbi:MAG: HigA family addiction module antidote protein [Proteobacteria bacterium]|nr:HigA family addiction module antidote protein [Pseudomonadota bacterium]MCH8323149.1 HigA family addiction module antidote protein [Pseudomonadota bacterium]
MPEFTGKRALPPTLPGVIVKQILDENEVTITAAAIAMGISRQLLHLIIAGNAAITADTAVRLGAYFGNGPDLWLNLQNKYNIYRANMRLEKEVKRIPLLETKCA